MQLQDGGSWGHLGSKLGGLGGILAPSWGFLGPSWLQVGGSWLQVGPSWLQVVSQVGNLKQKYKKYQKCNTYHTFGGSEPPSWSYVGAMLGLCWAMLDHFGSQVAT